MALQQVIRDWISLFDSDFVNRLDAKFNPMEIPSSENGLSCRSCGVDFEYNDFVHSQYKCRGKAVTRHLHCAILHNVISLGEAKQIAPAELHVNWSKIQQQAEQRIKERRSLVIQFCYWMMAGGFVAFLTTNGLLL